MGPGVSDSQLAKVVQGRCPGSKVKSLPGRRLPGILTVLNTPTLRRPPSSMPVTRRRRSSQPTTETLKIHTVTGYGKQYLSGHAASLGTSLNERDVMPKPDANACDSQK